VATALEAGAAAAVVGTRFLLSQESRAHPEYKRRCLDAPGTILTELFGLGWPGAQHRVIPNAATARWLGEDGRCPGWISAAQRITKPLADHLPDSVQARALGRQRSSLPLLSPQPPTDDGPDGLLDSGPLYAGQAVTEISDVLEAADIVSQLTP
jgi:NAD(P)H-dependent flavin oxidoreductase YrpB (nitropropane dioxygenase family)